MDEERQAAHVIHMKVAEEDVGFYCIASREHRLAQLAKARPGVENKEMVAKPKLNTGSVSAVSRGLRSGAGDPAARTPKANRQTIGAGNRSSGLEF